MRKYYLFTLLLIISGLLTAQSTYSGNLSVAKESYFSGYEDSSDYYVGGCNAFPIGTFVNIKLPYSDDTVDVKIVSRIPEDGIFILIDKRAGEQLYLETGDVLPVRIQVIDFVPPPLTEIDEDPELDPEPEMKGLTALNDTSAEDGVEPVNTDDNVHTSVVPESEVELSNEEPTVEPENIIDSDNVHTSEVHTSDVITSEENIPEESDDTLAETVDVTTEPEMATEDIPMEVEETVDETEETVTEIDNVLTSETELVEDRGLDEDVVFDDELPVESMFDFPEESIEEATEEVLSESSETVTEEDKPAVKRIYYLEPANSKPPVGGIPDSELIPVTTVDREKILEDGYYLQVGIYTNSDMIFLDSDKLDSLNFPYLRVKESDGEKRERLLVGPLSNDELGVIMLHLKSQGFKDFFRYKKKL